MSDTFRAMCAELVELSAPVDSIPQLTERLQKLSELAHRARALLAQPKPVGLTDEALLELMPQQFRDDLATVSRLAAHGAGSDITPGIFRVSLNTGGLDYARAAIAADRARRPTPQPPADGEVGELATPTDDAWFHELVSEIARVQHVAAGDGQGPRFDLAEAVARCCRPTPQPPADGEVGELVTLFAVGGHCGGGVKIAPEQCRRVSDLLQRFVSPACYVISPSPEALASLKAAGPGRFEALPVLVPAAQPVAVSERLPGSEDCDEQGRCWVFDDQLGLPSWTLIRVQGESLAPDMYWLPANALPLPQGHDS